MRYKVNLKQTDEGYTVWCQILPRCASQGDTKEEALINIQNAIESYLEVLEEINKDSESFFFKSRKLEYFFPIS
jgi:predicted RNase H-like HicB family nuclease